MTVSSLTLKKDLLNFELGFGLQRLGIRSSLMFVTLFFFFVCHVFGQIPVTPYANYRDSLFYDNMADDINGVISGYYDDLTKILSDLKQLEHLVLPFQRFERNTGIFEYQATPLSAYHLKQNYYLRLFPQSSLDFSCLNAFTFTAARGDCSAVSLYQNDYEMHPFDPTEGLDLVIDGDKIQLKIVQYALLESGASIFLFVPDNCVLHLTRVHRHQFVMARNTWKYSRQNNRPVELIGLRSNVIHNISPFNYITSLDDLPSSSFSIVSYRYVDLIAEFKLNLFDDDQPYVVPQNTSLEFVPLDGQLNQDTTRIVFRVSDLEKCRDLLQDPDTELFDLTVDMSTQSSPLILTPPDCELHVVEAIRTQKLRRHSNVDKLLRYGDAWVHGAGPSAIQSLATRIAFIETVSDFPELTFVYQPLPGVFEFAVHPIQEYILPRDL